MCFVFPPPFIKKVVCIALYISFVCIAMYMVDSTNGSMESFGNFDLQFPDIDVIDFLLWEDFELGTIDMEQFSEVCGSVHEELQNILCQPAITDLPTPETPSVPKYQSENFGLPPKRFKISTEEELMLQSHTAGFRTGSIWYQNRIDPVSPT
jgi:hypothetical protein